MKLPALILYLLCVFCQYANAQKQGNIWYFGDYAGLDFNSGVPIALKNGKMTTYEGCASICNTKGQLLFYTDGVSVWDRRHKLMPNGQGTLYGNSSSSQSGVIVPIIGDTSRYYIFTVDDQAGPQGVCYSIVNMAKNGGYGDLTSTNNYLYGPSLEKITCVPTSDGTGYWVITHAWKSNTFKTYKATASGVNTTPVLSNVGTVISSTSTNASIGYMVASPNGSKIAMASSYQVDVELFDFDNSTGIVSNPIALNNVGNQYGIAFSPTGNMLYITNFYSKKSHISQYDLRAADILKSEYQIPTDDDYIFGAISLAPNGKLYITRDQKQFLDVINEPELPGSSCNYVHMAVKLASSTNGRLGLPNFIPAFFFNSIIKYKANCINDSILFYREIVGATDSIRWNFGDPLSGAENFSKSDTNKHLYSKTGTYTVTLFSYYNGKKDSTSIKLTISPKPVPYLGKDTSICNGNSFYLQIPAGFDSPKWQDSSTANKFLVKTEGKYWVKAKQNNCLRSDTIVVKGKLTLLKSTNLDTTICIGQYFTKDFSQNECTYIWNDGDTTARKTFKKAGLFTLKVHNNCFDAFDTVIVKTRSPLLYSLGNDTILCPGETITLIGPDSATYLWQDGSKSPTYTANKQGIYILKATNRCGSVTDSLELHYHSLPKQLATIDSIVCAPKAIKVDVAQPGCKYLWQDGFDMPNRNLSVQGTYLVKVYNRCATVTDTIELKVEHPLKFSLGIDTILCTTDTITLHAKDSATYLWQDGSTANRYTVKKTGTYWLTERNLCGQFTDSVLVQYTPPYISRLPKDTTLCEGDSLMVNAYCIPGKYSWSNGIQGSKASLKSGANVLTFKNLCQNVKDTIKIGTDSFCNCYLYAPDIFSPDNNGINESWKPSSCTYYKSYLLQVYDRWGERVFTTNNLNEGWDGKFRGQDAMEGMYIYLIKLVDVHNSNNYKSGRFYLIRN